MARHTEGQAATIKEPEFMRVVAHVRNNSATPERDVAILQISYRAGLRAKEIAGLTIEDIIYEDGSLREVVTLRSAVTKGSKVGKAFLSHPQLRAALEEYVENRSKLKSDSSSLFVTQRKAAFTANAMSKLFTKLYKGAGIEGGTSHSGRRSLASSLIKKKANIYQVKEILRHSSIQSTSVYFSEDEDTLCDLLRS